MYKSAPPSKKQGMGKKKTSVQIEIEVRVSITGKFLSSHNNTSDPRLTDVWILSHCTHA